MLAFRYHAVFVAIPLILGTSSSGLASTIGTYKVDTLDNTAGCPYDGSPADRNPYACPTLLPPGPYFIDAPAGEYELTATAIGTVGPGNIYLWDGDASSGTSYVTPRAVGQTLDFTHTIGQIVLYDYDWYPFDNDLQESTTLLLQSVPASTTPEPGTVILLVSGLMSLAVGTVRRKRFAHAGS